MVSARGLLIVNADDFGESAATTRGILEAMDAGVVTSTTILANQPGTEEALRLARERGKSASFGVHLNLCEGNALVGARGAPSLVDASGVFRAKRAQGLRALARRLDPADVARELGAQIARVREAGVEVSHLDGHKHLHQLPGVASVVARLAREHGIERVRCTRERGAAPAGAGAAGRASRAARVIFAAAFARRLRALGLRFPAETLDLHALVAAPGPGPRLQRLAALRAPAELFCHPGALGGDASSSGPPRARAERRDAERAWLVSGELRVLAHDAGLRLGSYWEL